MLKIASSTQVPLSLSSAESEWYALVRGGCVAIGFANMAKDLGRVLQPRLHGDATAASGIAHRRGAGRVRHSEVRTLWLQRHITEKKIILHRRPGNLNESDIGTKYLPRPALDAILGRLGFHDREGRPALALRASLGDSRDGLSVGSSPVDQDAGSDTNPLESSRDRRSPTREEEG